MKKTFIISILLGFFIVSSKIIFAKPNQQSMQKAGESLYESHIKAKPFIKVYFEGKVVPAKKNQNKKSKKNQNKKLKRNGDLQSCCCQRSSRQIENNNRFESERLVKIISQSTNARYMPYLQFGAAHFFNLGATGAFAADAFIPLWQHNLTDLIFMDFRINDYTGRPIEGNVHLGYRHLFSNNQSMFGVYGAFDRRKTQLDAYFNQILIGGELWLNKLFVGANIYTPISGAAGSSKFSKKISKEEIDEPGTPYYNIYNVIDKSGYLYKQKAMFGGDAEVGYEVVPGLVGYVGVYYFNAGDADTVFGPRLRLTYDWAPANGERVLNIFDQVGFEAGVRHDNPRGTVWLLGVNLRLGWLPCKKVVLEGVSRHMVDLIRRDPDIVVTAVKGVEEYRSIKKKPIGRAIKFTGKPEEFHGFVEKVWNKEPDVTHIDVRVSIPERMYHGIELTMKKLLAGEHRGKIMTIRDHGDEQRIMYIKKNITNRIFKNMSEQYPEKLRVDSPLFKQPTPEEWQRMVEDSRKIQLEQIETRKNFGG